MRISLPSEEYTDNKLKFCTQGFDGFKLTPCVHLLLKNMFLRRFVKK